MKLGDVAYFIVSGRRIEKGIVIVQSRQDKAV